MTRLSVIAVLTLLEWAGLALLLAGMGRIVRSLLTKESAELAKSAVLAAAGAALGLICASLLAASGPAVSLRLVWFILPFWGWLAVALGLLALGRVFRALTAVGAAERGASWTAAAFFGLGAAVSCAVIQLTHSGKFKIVSGAVPLSWPQVGFLLVLAVAVCVLMAAASVQMAARGIVRTLAAHASLLLGSVVFGLPFAFLLVTSFKEDQDMSSANGIVWVPHVQQTVPYFDKKNPLYEAHTSLGTVYGTVIEDLGGGQVKLDVFRPISVRGTTVNIARASLKESPRDAPLVNIVGAPDKAMGMVIEDFEDGRRTVRLLWPEAKRGQEVTFLPAQVTPVRQVGLRWQNYTDALEYMPPETSSGLVYLRNTLIIVILSVIGTLLSSSAAAYAFSRLKFPGRSLLFAIMFSTMMLPAAVTLIPQFMIFKHLHWVDTLLPLWVPAFFGSAFNIFMLCQFFSTIPMELEDAAKVDGCSHLRTFWSVLLPQVKPALAVIAIWTFMGAWNNFMGPLIYISSPENMPISYALNIFKTDRSAEPGLLMAFSTLTILPVLALFFAAQKYFIEGASLSGFGGR